MAAYYIDEAVFELPDLGFVDCTLHRLESPLSGGDALTIEVRRAPIERGKSVRQLVDGEHAAQRSKHDGFQIIQDAETSIGGAGAIVTRARLRALDAVYSQHKGHVAHGDTWITFAVTGPQREQAACEEAFERVLTSLEWRTE